MFGYLEHTLLAWANALPLEVFVIVASCVEEIVIPIPSPAVMIAAGSIAALQGYSLLALGALAVFGALGKTIGAVIVYVVTDKMEDVVMHRFSRFIGITHEEIEAFGAQFTGNWKDYFLLTALRALPIVPSYLLSIGGGALKIPMRLFVVSTFLGTIIRDSLYLYFGFVGASALGAFIARSATLESAMLYIVVGAVAVLILYSSIRIRNKKRGG